MRTPPSQLSFPVTVTFTGDWGVKTGTGVVGGVDATVERDRRDRPVVRATALTGVVREQARIVAEALDDGESSGGWHTFTEALFGTPELPRLVSFSDALVEAGEDVDVHMVVSLSICEETGTAKPDHLRFGDRAGACTLKATATLTDTDLHSAPIKWSREQRDAAVLVLSLACSLVPAIGSDRSNGDGACRIVLGEHADAEAFRQWCRRAVAASPEAPEPPCAGRQRPAPRLGMPAGSGDDAAVSSTALRMHLETPVVSYEVPLSNEVRSLDFLRGAVVLPWVHSRLRNAFPDDDLVRDAVVNGDLLVSDALPVLDGVRGLPIPLVLSVPKNGAGGETERVANRLHSPEPDEVHRPLREGYVFSGVLADDTARAVTLGAPPLTARQSTAHDAATGTASDGQLFLVRALSAGVDLEVDVVLTERLRRVVGERLPELLTGRARMGSRRLSGAFGRVLCTVTGPPAAPEPRAAWEGPPEADGRRTTTLWFTSDLLLRSGALGRAGTLDDVLASLRAAGADVVEATTSGTGNTRFTAGLRHRRVDSWAAAERQPRATRVAIRAGSVVRVTTAQGADPDAVLTVLEGLSCTGLGELTAQGYGRMSVGHPLLTREDFPARRPRPGEFLSDGSALSQEARQ